VRSAWLRGDGEAGDVFSPAVSLVNESVTQGLSEGVLETRGLARWKLGVSPATFAVMLSRWMAPSGCGDAV
jgi:hypothetical protein